MIWHREESSPSLHCAQWTAEVALTPATSEQARACRVREVAVVEGVVRSWSQGCVDRAFGVALELFGIKKLSALTL